MLKRCTSLLVSLAMMLSLLPGSALATETTSVQGKTISILGDSISTYTGVSNDASVNATLAGGAVYYNGSKQNITRADTWWQQTIDVLDLELLVNNSWSGSCIFPTRAGTVGAYVNRCTQLHNDKTGEEPDIIAVFLGTNDFYNFQSTLGTADIDYDALITENSDGTYAYAEPATVCEAYAVILHKMTERYPEADIYCMTMLPTREGKAVGQPTAFNAALEEIIETFGCTMVDLENCGITSDTAVFDQYITDQYVHPGPKGMDLMTQTLVRAMTGEEDTALCDITLQLNHVTTGNEAHVVLGGKAYSNTLCVADGYKNLKVTVTMDGKNITADCYTDGKISIPDVTGDIVITASATIDKDQKNYRWEFDGTELVSVTTGDNAQNTLTKLAGTCSNGTLNNTRYQLAEEVVLNPDQPWVIKWECSGAWSGLLLSSHAASATKGMNYLFRSSGANRLLAFGEYTGSQYDNYGIPMAEIVSTPNANHVYRVENRIANDGSNSVYLLVDGVELGVMDDYYIGGDSNQNKNVDWLNGNDFVFGYLGTSAHPLNNLKLKYLQVWEGGEPESPVSTEPVDLFVFAGQSNMMGAAVLEPETDTFTNHALEYKYMPKLRGKETGSFVSAQNPAGEFHYKNLTVAYGDKLNDLTYKSSLTDYAANTFFCPAMRSETKGFAAQCEADTYPSASLPPYFVTEYADYGHSSVYAHMAKGGVKIAHYFTEEMMARYNALISEYNAQNGSVYPALNHPSGAGNAFDNEYDALLEDYAKFAPDSNVENKCFVWLQGESDASGSYIEYKLKMQVLWEHLQELGFSHFFVLRVGYWGNKGILNVIKAQEDFCAENDNCYIVTRAPSLIPYPGTTIDNWWISEPDAEYDDCRDSYVVNSSNHHFNEKAFRIFAERSAANVHRILHQGLEPILEEENIQGMPMEQPDEDETPYTSYVGAEVFWNNLSVSKPSDTWEELSQPSAGSTDLIPVKSTDSVWLQYVFFKNEAHAVGGFYDAAGNLVAPLYYKQFGFVLDGNTGGVSAFQTPAVTNRVSIAEVEAETGKEIAFVRFTAWKASAGGHTNTEARIYHEAHSYAGKVISIMGDSISTFAGYIPEADGFNLEHLARYPQDNLLTDVNETWWMQVIRELDAKLGVNDSWRGSTLSGGSPVTSGTTGENAAMSNLTRIQNLGSNGTPDIILLYGGTNDLAHVSKVGAFDPDTAPSTADLTTKKWDNLADGFVHTLLRLKHYYPDAEIVAMLPTYTTSYYSDEKLAQGNAVMASICEHYDVPYVDLRDCGITTADLPDGIHPDATGMDFITDAVLETLFAECEMTVGENTVYSVTHDLTDVSASLGYYKGVSAGKAFTETLTVAGDMTVTVTMGGTDITDSCYADGKITIPAVTGNVNVVASREVPHVHTHTPVVTLPTCTEQGYTTYTCACGDSYKADYVAAAEHSFGAWGQTVAPTCTDAGEERRDCVNCEHYELRDIDALGHTSGTAVRENEVAATCTTAGSYDEVVYCTVCEEELSRTGNSIPMLDHDWNSGEITTQPTCTAVGVKTFICQNDASHTKIEPVEMLPHVHSDAWTFDATGHWHTCICGDKAGAADHVPSPAATATTAQTCTVCAYVLTPATGEEGSGAPDGSAGGGGGSAGGGGGGGLAGGGLSPIPGEMTEETRYDKEGNTLIIKTKEDGTTGTTTIAPDGRETVDIELSSAAVKNAQKNDDAVELPMAAVTATKDSETAPVVNIVLPKKSKEVRVELLVENHTAGTVVVLVSENGTETVIPTTSQTESGVVVTIFGDTMLKVLDKSVDFIDVVPGSTFAAYIDFVSARGLFNGTTATTFEPNAQTSRGQVMTVLARLDGADTSGAPIQKGMAWAKDQGISDGTNPNAAITRQQLATMLWRYAGEPESRGSIASYSDADLVSAYAESALAWCVEYGIMTGYADGRLNPHGNATRAHVAAMVARYVTWLES